MMREEYLALIQDPDTSPDYATYLNCERLLGCQKSVYDLCNGDELQFQIVHQVEELWMKLIAFTLADVIKHIRTGATLHVVSLFNRVHLLQRLMIQQFNVLETMSPKSYQEIRLLLGNGSGRESPGFQILMKLPPDLWSAFEEVYLKKRGLTVDGIYDKKYSHDESYVVAEAMIQFDELFQKFLLSHILLINRTIGSTASSLKGRPVEILNKSASRQLFPALWQIRGRMTDTWGESHGVVRNSLMESGAENF